MASHETIPSSNPQQPELPASFDGTDPASAPTPAYIQNERDAVEYAKRYPEMAAQAEQLRIRVENLDDNEDDENDERLTPTERYFREIGGGIKTTATVEPPYPHEDRSELPRVPRSGHVRSYATDSERDPEWTRDSEPLDEQQQEVTKHGLRRAQEVIDALEDAHIAAITDPEERRLAQIRRIAREQKRA